MTLRKQVATMDDPLVQSRPRISSFTPINHPQTKISSLQAPNVCDPPDETSTAATLVTGTSADESNKTKKRKRPQPTASKAEIKGSCKAPCKGESKSSIARSARGSLEVSQMFQETKPGICRDSLSKEWIKEGDPHKDPWAVDIAPICTLANVSSNQQTHQLPQVVTKSTSQSLSRTYQEAFATCTTIPDHVGSPRPSQRSSVTLVDNIETLMDTWEDDATFFENLKCRPQKAIKIQSGMAQEILSHELDYLKVNQLKDLERTRYDEDIEPGQGALVGGSSFYEALEASAVDETAISEPLPYLVNPIIGGDSHIMNANYGNTSPRSISFTQEITISHTSEEVAKVASAEPDRRHEEADEFDESPIDDDEVILGENSKDNRIDDETNARENGDFQIHTDTPLLDPYEDLDLDSELINISTAVSERVEGQSPPFTQITPPRHKAQAMPVITLCARAIPAGRPQTKSPSNERSSPSTPTRAPLADTAPNTSPHTISFAKDGKAIPFIRPAFPSALLPRSPIAGLSPTTVLRTCFRIGEALNAASLALRSSTDALIELYCRVKYSDREANGYKQYFELADLFNPEKPPFLNGVYAIWKGVGLWDYDSKAFVGKPGSGKLARVLGRIKRGKANKGWEMTILNAWEATWEDVGVVKGVIFS